MSRDWQKDMALCKKIDGNSPWSRELLMAEQPDITIYWLQQYAAEKERGDIAELAYQGLAEIAVTRGEYQSLLDKHTAMTKAYRAEKERVDKLSEAIEWVKQMFESEWTYELGVGEVVDEIIIKFDSLYPKEETKP